ncbi:SWIM zinc finger family protein [Gordonia caeni]|uniref:2-oxo acid dehydrogenase n=1 Tax=Gordonia caeni TaxID=1007097 RepID=A0ABP7NZX8_9ACTN
MAQRKRSRSPVRGYGITSWGRAFAAVVEAGADHRHLTGARRYFRDHHVDGLAIAPGQVTAAVRGSQLEPFEVALVPRTVDAQTVVDLLRRTGDVDALLALARGEQPAALGALIAPTESADVASSCTCPDEAPRCIHVLAVAFEVSAQIDKQPVTLLRVMGTDLPDLLALAQDRESTDQSAAGEASPGAPATPAEPASSVELAESFYGDRVRIPRPPTFPRVDALSELDAAALRSALRASGVGATAMGEAVDDLAELYAVLRDHR